MFKGFFGPPLWHIIKSILETLFLMAFPVRLVAVACAIAIGVGIGGSHSRDRSDIQCKEKKGTNSFKLATRRIRRAGRIVNGDDVSIKEFPFLVSIQLGSAHEWRHHCGGSIVNDHVILTACHCVVQHQRIDGHRWKIMNPDGVRVVAGTTYLPATNHFTQISKVKRMAAHPGCSNHKTANGEYINDVAVVFLQTHLKLSPAVQAMKFYSHDTLTNLIHFATLVRRGERCSTAGWGLTHEKTGKTSDTLKVVKVRLLTTRECQRRFCSLGSHCETNFSVIHQVCVVSEDSSACYGDSGGPLVCDGYVYGSVSFGRHCYPGWPTVFQNIQPALEMIRYVNTRN